MTADKFVVADQDVDVFDDISDESILD